MIIGCKDVNKSVEKDLSYGVVEPHLPLVQLLIKNKAVI